MLEAARDWPFPLWGDASIVHQFYDVNAGPHEAARNDSGELCIDPAGQPE